MYDKIHNKYSKQTESRNTMHWKEIIIIIIIIIAPLTTVSEDQWEDLECLYKACQAARTDGGLLKLKLKLKTTI